MLKQALWYILSNGFSANVQIFLNSCFTKYVGHLLMDAGIASPGYPIENIAKDLIWFAPAITITASFINTIFINSCICRKPPDIQPYDGLQIGAKFFLGVCGFTLGYCPNESLVFGTLGMSLALYIVEACRIIVYKHREKNNRQREILDGNASDNHIEIALAKKESFLKLLLASGYEAKDIIPKAAGEALCWGFILKWNSENQSFIKNISNDDPLKIKLLASFIVALCSSSGFVLGGWAGNILNCAGEGLKNGIKYSIGQLTRWWQKPASNEEEQERLVQGQGSIKVPEKSEISLQT